MASCEVRAFIIACMLPFVLSFSSFSAETEVPCYGIHEVSFEGPTYGPKDAPARDVELATQWRHETGLAYTIHGFWDGDGTGGASGSVFKVRSAVFSRYASALPTRANGRSSRHPPTRRN